jgi:hypothetical protein
MGAAGQRRGLRFGRRTLFVGLAIVGCWLGWNVHRVQERAEMRQDIGWRGAIVASPGRRLRTLSPSSTIRAPGTLPAMWSLMGAWPVGVIGLPDDTFSADEMDRIGALFPEAEIVAVHPDQSGVGFF